MTTIGIILTVFYMLVGVSLASILPLVFECRYDTYRIEENYNHAIEAIINGTYNEEEEAKYKQEHPAYQIHSSILLPD